RPTSTGSKTSSDLLDQSFPGDTPLIGRKSLPRGNVLQEQLFVCRKRLHIGRYDIVDGPTRFEQVVEQPNLGWGKLPLQAGVCGLDRGEHPLQPTIERFRLQRALFASEVHESASIARVEQRRSSQKITEDSLVLACPITENVCQDQILGKLSKAIFPL